MTVTVTVTVAIYASLLKLTHGPGYGRGHGHGHCHGRYIHFYYSGHHSFWIRYNTFFNCLGSFFVIRRTQPLLFMHGTAIWLCVSNALFMLSLSEWFRFIDLHTKISANLLTCTQKSLQNLCKFTCCKRDCVCLYVQL